MTPSSGGGVASLLRDRDFLRLWVAGALVWTVRWLEILSVALYTLAATGSAFAVAMMLFARMAPQILLAGLVGAFAERVDRRWLLAAGFGLMALNVLVLGSLSYAGLLELWHVGLGAFVTGIGWSGEHAVRRTLLGEIAGAERIAKSTSLDSAANQVTRMLGPLTGGVLFAAVGLTGAYFIGAALYVTGFVCVVTVKHRPRVARNAGVGLLRSIAEGLRHVRGNRPIAATLAITVVMNLFAFPMVSMVPVICERQLGLGPAATGTLMSIDGLGAVIGSVTLAVFIRTRHFLPICLGGSMLLLSMMLCFSLSDRVELSALCLFVAGIGFAGFAAMQSAVLLSEAPVALRTRLMGILAVCIGTGPIGVLMLGLLAEWLGAPGAVAVSAAVGLVGLVASALAWPELRGRGRVS